MDIEQRYSEETISHSGLNAFAISPRAFRKYKDIREEGDDTYSLSLGSAVHCAILEPEEFYDRYVIAPEEVPTPMYKVFVETLANTYPSDQALTPVGKEAWYKNAYEVAGFKNPSFPRAVEKFETDSVMQKYFRFLLSLGGDKQPLSPEDLTKVNLCKSSTANHKLAAKLLYGGNPFAESLNEFEIIWNYPGYKFKMKSIIDRLVIDHEAKQVLIIDLKTTSKNVYSFSNSYATYSYHRQLYLYGQAVRWYLRSLDKNPDDYKIFGYIVAVQTKDLFETLVYVPDSESLVIAKEEVEALLSRLRWHFENNLWDYAREYYEGPGYLVVGLPNGRTV